MTSVITYQCLLHMTKQIWSTRDKEQNVYGRVRSEEAVTQFKNDLLTQNQEVVYQKEDISEAYENFLEVFMELCNKICPIGVTIITNINIVILLG